MGLLINGQWQTEKEFTNIKEGSFKREESFFRNTISAAEPNRYHLYISYACPWAHRTIIMRLLKGLENVISFSSVDAYMSEQGWSFNQYSKNTEDPLYQKKYLYEIYIKAKSDYSGRVTVPVLWDKKQETIVNNESSEIIRMLNFEFNDYASSKTDYYPKDLHKEIDEINHRVYHTFNNGVYKCGFAKKQEVYEQAFDELFETLDFLEAHLSKTRYLVGNTITEADIRLFTTLVRFDPVYYMHFKCNWKRIADYPNLLNYLRDLYQHEAFKNTVDFNHIKIHYYQSHKTINPSGIIPKGPEFLLDLPHGRNVM